MHLGPRIKPPRLIKRIVPRTLLSRSLLIILLPMVILQGVALRIFYGSHLDLLSRRLSSSVAGEISFTVDMLEHLPPGLDRALAIQQARQQFEMAIHLQPGAILHPRKRVNVIGPFDDDLDAALKQKLNRPFFMDWEWTGNPAAVLVRVQVSDGVLDFEAPRKRLYFATVYFFVVWLVGSSFILFIVAALFMRNQVRAIRRLASAAEAFGIGRDLGPIRPEGAVEVRRAATAFNRMRERVLRFLIQRTEMLAGVSHDLRTPLTRLRLALAVLPREDAETEAEIEAMEADLAEMDRMIGGYLAFARGEGTEQAQPTNLAAVLADIAASARRAGAEVDLETPEDLTLKLRADAVRRAITNLVDNARRHGRHIALAALRTGTSVMVTVDDDGPGIPPPQREAVFRPFESGAIGGTGLGLTIARDIVRAHGGDIFLEESPLGGLRARVRLPA
jgi:two-component system, OmpR family, osmolarity sensor histidine kinase EnvZ